MNDLTSRSARVALGFSALALALSACSAPTDRHPASPVNFHLTAAATAPSLSTAATNGLAITSLRVAVSGAALGSGSQYGCVDCQGNNVETNGQPTVVTVPLDGSSVALATESVNVGTYASVEISLEPLGSGGASWPAGASMVIEGTYNGAAFTLPLSVSGSFVESLSPPVTVSTAGASSVNVKVTLPVANWFTANGRALDPANAADRAQIEANARSAFQALDSSESGTPEHES